ncbi:carbohydrate ABC transporter permease [Lederbergia panacisoli]|uniref:carbohydrate ABC transporter permease n=1 Tax=Lederbergia panacisoli TaxID=1255251 RepID=UPI00214CB19D|nr:sugar ABC transporter permease [Lederbergia panacisoli]MCR2822986.1 sugar ABC transporter permease [Lederbergia panacisoli]
MNSKWNKTLPYLMISPYLIVYGIFILIPLIWVFYLSFTNYTPMNPGNWIGFDNFEKLFNDIKFKAALRNTGLFWIFTVIPSMIIGLLVATFLNTKIKGSSIFRAIIYLPGVMSGVAVAMTWLWIYDPQNGPVNLVLKAFGGTGKHWLRNPETALPAIIIIGIWMAIGFSMIIYTAGLQGISQELYEAASIDGANTVRKFLSITVPLLRPITFFLFIMNTITSFQVFDIVYIMTGGGPANATTTIVNEIVKTGFETFNMGYASSMSIALLIITLVFTLINYWLNPKESDS